jgi:hypothetical protein
MSQKAEIRFDVVAGHAGKLVFGTLGKNQVPAMLLVGRAQLVASHLHSLTKIILAHLFLSQFLRRPRDGRRHLCHSSVQGHWR